MTTKDQVLADIKDLVTTFIRKTIELRDNPDLRDKWKAKNKRLQDNMKELTAEEFEKVEKEYLEWMELEFPEAKGTQILKTGF